MIVLDASAAVSALLNNGQARQMIAAEAMHAPHLVDTEVASALRRQAAAGILKVDNAKSALDIWQRLALVRYAAAPLLGRVWELRHGLSAYDAVYVALAEGLECALVTADARLGSAAGIRCPVTVVPD